MAGFVLKHLCWSLIMPDQSASNDEHVVFLAEGRVAVSRGKFIFVGLGMNTRPFQGIFRSNGIEALFN
jgi:hypothetical protein